MFDIETELKKLPKKPGVYIMKDINDNIIYVGKAVVLRNRVRQYFRKNNKTKRIENMVSLIDHFEYIVTDNEAEALILECNLIKENRPKFNVLLKDDKTYPYIKIDVKSDYPNVQNGNFILAGHSGNSKISYFNNLHKLKKDDLAYVFFSSKEYVYKLVDKYEIDKTGVATIIRNTQKSTMTLITCTTDNKKQVIFIFELTKVGG